MPVDQLGATYYIYVPNPDQLIALGYTHLRVYWASSEGGTFSHVNGTSTPLVAATYSYSYNNPSGIPTDFAQHCYYGATPGESAKSEPVAVSIARSTRSAIRQGVGMRTRQMYALVDLTSVTDGDTVVADELVDVDGQAEQFANWWARSGTQSRRVRSGANGYVPSTGTLNFRRAFNPSLSASDFIELWRPRGFEDPTALVDDAMQRARSSLWFEETWYFATTTNQTEYYLPAGVIANEGQVQSVEWNAGTYPDRPVWRPAWASVSFVNGTPMLSARPSGANSWSTGTLLRVRVNRFGDRMDSESDYWPVPLEWAIAETAREFVKVFGAATGSQEDMRDWRAMLKDLQQECAEYRAMYYPAVEARVEMWQ